MVENWEERLVSLLKKINEHYNISLKIESLENKDEIFELIKIVDADLYKIVSEYYVLYDSYRFVRADKMLMLKSREVWMMERELMVSSLKEIDADLIRVLGEKGVAM